MNQDFKVKELAVGIVLYKPNRDILTKLKIINDYGLDAFIFENSPSNELSLVNDESIFYQNDKKNPGLGKGMKVICTAAYNKGIKSLLYFDQDTQFSNKTLDYSLSVLSKIEKEYSSYSAISLVEDNLGHHDKDLPKAVKLIRNSGTIFNLHNLEKINWFDETFFIDGVDYEFCHKSLNNNLKIGSVGPAPDFDHTSEQGYSNYSLFIFSTKGRIYELSRISDIIISSVRILGRAIVSLNFVFAIKIFALLVFSMFHQVLLRFSKEENI